MSAETPQPEQTPQKRHERAFLAFLAHVSASRVLDCVCRRGIECDPLRKARQEMRDASAHPTTAAPECR